jgi:hypothetical protein
VEIAAAYLLADNAAGDATAAAASGSATGEASSHNAAPSSYAPLQAGLPKLVETLSLCYLGALLLRVSVSLGDFYRFVGLRKLRQKNGTPE